MSPTSLQVFWEFLSMRAQDTFTQSSGFFFLRVHVCVLLRARANLGVLLPPSATMSLTLPPFARPTSRPPRPRQIVPSPPPPQPPSRACGGRSMCAGGTLTVGVTSDSMLKAKSNAKMVSSLPERLEGVTDFLRCGQIFFFFHYFEALS